MSLARGRLLPISVCSVDIFLHAVSSCAGIPHRAARWRLANDWRLRSPVRSSKAPLWVAQGQGWAMRAHYWHQRASFRAASLTRRNFGHRPIHQTPDTMPTIILQAACMSVLCCHSSILAVPWSLRWQAPQVGIATTSLSEACNRNVSPRHQHHNIESP
jgi:hypothetical protein